MIQSSASANLELVHRIVAEKKHVQWKARNRARSLSPFLRIYNCRGIKNIPHRHIACKTALFFAIFIFKNFRRFHVPFPSPPPSISSPFRSDALSRVLWCDVLLGHTIIVISLALTLDISLVVVVNNPSENSVEENHSSNDVDIEEYTSTPRLHMRARNYPFSHFSDFPSCSLPSEILCVVWTSFKLASREESELESGALAEKIKHMKHNTFSVLSEEIKKENFRILVQFNSRTVREAKQLT